eukprot:1129469-Pleurochrysis_carterae.AAC.1
MGVGLLRAGSRDEQHFGLLMTDAICDLSESALRQACMQRAAPALVVLAAPRSSRKSSFPNDADRAIIL